MRSRVSRYLIPMLLFISLAFWFDTQNVQAQGTVTGSYQNLALGGGRLSVTMSVSLLRWDELRIEVNATDMTDEFRLLTPGWSIAGIRQDSMGHWYLGLQRQRPGTGVETVMIDGPEGRGRLGRVVLLQNGTPIVTATSQPTFMGVELAPPGGGLFSSLKRYDANGDNLINDPEFFAIIDAWVAGQVDNDKFFQALDLWVSQRPISSAGLPRERMKLDSISLAVEPLHGATFLANGQRIASMGVKIYDLGGRQIFAEESAGTRLTWNWSAQGGESVANGVYLYVVTVRGAQGQMLRSPVKKLVVLF